MMYRREIDGLRAVFIVPDKDIEHRCIVQKNGDLLYGDDDHLSNAGARLVTNEVMGHLDWLLLLQKHVLATLD